MIRFIVRRIVAAFFVMIAVTIITFLLLAATGNQAARLAGKNATQQQIHQIAAQYGLDKPIYVQYVKTMKNIFTGKAYSYTQNINVLQEVKHDYPATLSLAFGAGIIWLGLSVLFGTLAAVYAGRTTDRVLTILSMAGVSFPPFFLGAIFLYFLGYKLGWFPLGGYVGLSDPWQWFKHLVLPWITLSILFIGFYSRVLRSTILDNTNEDYVRTAHAKGLTDGQVLRRHTLRNSMIPIISLWGLDMGQLLGGAAILTDSVFNLQGVGQLAATAIANLDVITIMVIVILTAFAVVLLSAIVDILYAVLDPRIRLA
ncbi:MAG TPA: ABC transporter permease [Solirubrobacteraceae bacterium]|nr:ABC transporter permease [Solirubrobacteraceae bacterium]